MWIFRLICWYRGFHRAPYIVTSVDSVRGVYGSSSACRVCRLRLGNGVTLPPEKSQLVLEWNV